MHLPDGIINNQISAGLLTVMAGFLAVSFAKLKKSFIKEVFVEKKVLALANGPSSESGVYQKSIFSKVGQEKIKLMIMLGALIFTFQLIDLPVLSFGAGHLLGGALAALVLGPWAGAVVMSAVLLIQASVLGDGGVMTLGVNFFNIGLVTVFASCFFYQLGSKFKLPQTLIIFLATWISVILASLFYLLTVNISNVDYAVDGVVPVHLIIGIIEALITILIIKTFKLKLFSK